MLLISYLAILDIITNYDFVYLPPYLAIPYSKKIFADLILLNVKQENTEQLINVALYFKEVLKKKEVICEASLLNKRAGTKKLI